MTGSILVWLCMCVYVCVCVCACLRVIVLVLWSFRAQTATIPCAVAYIGKDCSRI